MMNPALPNVGMIKTTEEMLRGRVFADRCKERLSGFAEAHDPYPTRARYAQFRYLGRVHCTGYGGNYMEYHLFLDISNRGTALYGAVGYGCGGTVQGTPGEGG